MVMKERTEKTIVLIHNLRNIKTMEQAKQAIDRDILKIFPNVQLEECPTTKAQFYKSDGIVHFIFAEQDSDAGNYYNLQTADKIRQWIANEGIDSSNDDLFFDRFQESLNRNLQVFLFNRTEENNFTVTSKSLS